jgi:hypothetical protein
MTTPELSPTQIVSAEIASDLDRVWFKANPGKKMYIREAFPDEFLVAYVGTVKVVQIAPGVRLRMQHEGYWVINSKEDLTLIEGGKVPPMYKDWVDRIEKEEGGSN